MRVIAGSAKGRKLRTLEGVSTRPTPARVREALFSMLEGLMALPGATVLDLFAGSGALGIEALSRGAAHADFVEASARAQTILRHNLGLFGRRATLHALPAMSALRRLDGRAFTLTFLDPPYMQNALSPSLQALERGGFVAPGGIVVCEHHTKSPMPAAPAGFEPQKSRTFGDVSICMLRRNTFVAEGCP